MKTWKVIARPIVSVVSKPVCAETPEEAVRIIDELIDWDGLFQDVGCQYAVESTNLYQPRPTHRRTLGDVGCQYAVESTNFADDFDCFIVDPVGADGEVDTENAVWLKGDGKTQFYPAQASKIVLWHVHDRGYVVNVMEDGEVVHEYTAGNSPLDSQVYVFPDEGLSWAMLRQFAEQTAHEIARERNIPPQNVYEDEQ